MSERLTWTIASDIAPRLLMPPRTRGIERAALTSGPGRTRLEWF
jgi:hypothetical protein